MTLRVPLALAAAALVAPALAGCLDPEAARDEHAVGGPGFDIGDEDFYHSYVAEHETWFDEFAWDNPSGKAFVEVRHSLVDGRELVTIKDANDATVFVQEFTPETREGRFYPGDGAPGEWTILIERRAAEGQLDLHVWRATTE